MSEFDIIVDNSQQNLKQVPSTILEMYNLRMLYLQQNFLKELPKDFFTKLPNLTWLDLRSNHLSVIPESIAYHQNLENLLLSDNKIAALPIALGLVPKLKVLQIAENPLEYPNKKIIAQGTKVIIQFLKSQYESILTPTNDITEDKLLEDKNKLQKVTNCKLVAKVESVPSLLVKKLTDTSTKNNGKVVHQIVSNKPKNKMYVKSYYKNNEESQNNEALKQNWMKSLKTILEEQEKILQQERLDILLKLLQKSKTAIYRNLKALTAWRVEKKLEPERAKSEEHVINAPYGMYPEYDSILTRAEVSQQIDRLIKKKKNPPRKQDVDKLINDLSAQLKEIQKSSGHVGVNVDVETASAQIMKVIFCSKW